MAVKQSLNRRGFERLELLVVVGIAIVLTSVTLPAMQNAREQARTASCANNLKQIAIALHNYHDTYNTLPPGWVTETDLPNSDGGFGWLTMILPFVEEASTYDRLQENLKQCDLPVLDGQKEYKDNSIEKLLQKEIPTFTCPFDRTSPVNPMRGYYGLSNYSGSYGSSPLNYWGPSDVAVNWAGALRLNQQTPNGLFYWNSKVRFADVTDGLSNTLMVGERAVQNGAGVWPGVRSNSHPNDAVTDCSYNNEYNTRMGSFSSQHEGGMNMMFGDGAVRFMSEEIDSQPDTSTGLKWIARGVYQKLANRYDGQVVETDNFFDKAR